LKVSFGYRAASEEHPADVLLQNSVVAEKVGFEFIVTSDHFHPWFHTDGHSSFALSWLGALGQATRSVRIGTGVTPPILRYHPALIAQAFGTLGRLYPGRVFVSVGTGEAMNEVPLGFPWPGFGERFERLREAIEIIKKLWSEDFVTYTGRYFKLVKANLYDKPSPHPPIYVAGMGEHTVRLAGEVADGYMGVPAPKEKYLEIFNILREACSKNGREFDAMPRMVEVFVSYDEDYDKALSWVSRWRTVLIPNVLASEIYDPRELEEKAKNIDVRQLTTYQVNVCTSVEEVIKAAEKYIGYGFNEIQLHSCSPDEAKFLDDFGSKGLQYLKQQYGKP
jgi:Coenzyme F420-dependent N5,N10-methylene tetrahydromethanopterin reductase and related flavin-dependent oxidoreductases